MILDKTILILPTYPPFIYQTCHKHCMYTHIHILTPFLHRQGEREGDGEEEEPMAAFGEAPRSASPSSTEKDILVS